LALLFLISMVSGLVVGVILFVVVGRFDPPSESDLARAPWTAWLVLAAGISGTAGFAFAVLSGVDSYLLMAPSISLPAAGIVLAAGRLRAGDRRWPVWAGATFALVPAAFWLVFLIGEVFGPPH